MAKSKNRTWIKQHVKDPYVVQSQRDGYRSRASYKLLEIVEKTIQIRCNKIDCIVNNSILLICQ